ncbi:MAG: YifB family Mg chelatase-like AAA ATPase [Planctomycetota bacterium]|jgi:magnesium chelatase family protein
MNSKIFSATINGLNAELIEVEADLSVGLNAFNIVGLPDKAVEESKERIGSAIKNCGALAPRQQNRRLTVNLAPADIKKGGSLYDLPISLAYLLSSGQINFESDGKIFAGELALDGAIRPVHGVLPIALLARRLAFKEIFIPTSNAREASLVKGIKIFGADHLKNLIEHLEGAKKLEPITPIDIEHSEENSALEWDFGQIRGLEVAKRALEIAAAGGHNMLMSGPPGGGKTILAKALPTILPQMSEEEILEVTKIYSVAGLLNKGYSIMRRRPFRAPHHTSSPVALVGGGSWPRPGEISLAHRGVLFMDELPEFARNVLEALRQPLEEGTIVVSRAASTLEFPAKFMFIGAMNPCPCGNYGNPKKLCTCTSQTISRYQRKISGPLLDRIDLHINVPYLEAKKLIGDEITSEKSTEVKKRVSLARKIQARRFADQNIKTNSEMGLEQIRRFCQTDSASETLLKQALDHYGLSARTYHRLLKLARTIADLAGEENIKSDHVSEAIQYRIQES